MPSVYLIVEPDHLIAQDLVQTLAEAEPDAVIVSSASLAAAGKDVRPHTAIDIAFLHVDGDELDATNLMNDLRARGAKFVMLNGTSDSTEENSASWVIVPVPFSSSMIVAAIEKCRNGTATKVAE